MKGGMEGGREGWREEEIKEGSLQESVCLSLSVSCGGNDDW